MALAHGNVDDLTQAAEAAFAAHPDATIITSFPGVGLLTGARLLAELGDDRARFADAKALKAYAGTASITRASDAGPWSARDEAATTGSWPPARCGR
jgi:transposase